MLRLCRAVRGSGIQRSEVDSGITPGLVSGVESRGSRSQGGRGLGVRGFKDFKIGSGVQGETLVDC